MKCEDCKFWYQGDRSEADNKYFVGWCQRFPPTIEEQGCETYTFPCTREDDWCGEFQSIEGKDNET